MMPTLSSLAEPELVVMTISNATSDDNVGIMKILVSSVIMHICSLNVFKPVYNITKLGY